MSTFEEFESAPVGATATHPDGRRVIKTTGAICPWHTTNGTFLYDYEIVDYVLDPLPPSSAREALDLAWELAHTVKEGQVVPAGTRYVSRSRDGGLTTFTANEDWKPSPRHAENLRTLDPLPDPEPDWTKAPAVLARIDEWEPCIYPQVWVRIGDSDKYESHCDIAPWQALRDVTPLYPKGQDR